MKQFGKLMAFVMVVLLASAAFAADAAATSNTKLSLDLPQATSFAGNKLEAGHYNVYVERHGDDANVRITSGSHEVVNTTAKYRQMTRFNGSTALAVDTSRNVQELQSSKLKGALVFSPAAPAMTTEGSAK
jgi:opacity protein-like surface antigen